MTVEEAIKELRRQRSMMGVPASAEAILMAILALEKEKEPQPEQADKDSSKNNSIDNDNIKTKACQEVIDLVATELIEFYRDQLSEEEQKAWTLGEVYRKVLDAQNLIEEAKQ